MSVLSSDVWERTGRETMNRHVFYLVLGGILAWGFFLTHLIAKTTATWQPGIFELLAVGLGIPILGIFMSASGNALLSFIGFNLVVAGLSAILGPTLEMYSVKQPGLVERAAFLTMITTCFMGASGFLFPKFYRSIGSMLFVALTALLVVRILQLFIPAIQDVGVFDYLAAGLFSLYIGFDMWRASSIPATLDNAVDVAVSLYLDIINLFLTLLRISSDD